MDIRIPILEEVLRLVETPLYEGEKQTARRVMLSFPHHLSSDRSDHSIGDVEMHVLFTRFPAELVYQAHLGYIVHAPLQRHAPAGKYVSLVTLENSSLSLLYSQVSPLLTAAKVLPFQLETALREANSVDLPLHTHSHYHDAFVMLRNALSLVLEEHQGFATEPFFNPRYSDFDARIIVHTDASNPQIHYVTSRETSAQTHRLEDTRLTTVRGEIVEKYSRRFHGPLDVQLRNLQDCFFTRSYVDPEALQAAISSSFPYHSFNLGPPRVNPHQRISYELQSQQPLS